MTSFKRWLMRKPYWFRWLIAFAVASDGRMLYRFCFWWFWLDGWRPRLFRGNYQLVAYRVRPPVSQR